MNRLTAISRVVAARSTIGRLAHRGVLLHIGVPHTISPGLLGHVRWVASRGHVGWVTMTPARWLLRRRIILAGVVRRRGPSLHLIIKLVRTAAVHTLWRGHALLAASSPLLMLWRSALVVLMLGRHHIGVPAHILRRAALVRASLLVHIWLPVSSVTLRLALGVSSWGLLLVVLHCL